MYSCCCRLIFVLQCEYKWKIVRVHSRFCAFAMLYVYFCKKGQWWLIYIPFLNGSTEFFEPFIVPGNKNTKKFFFSQKPMSLLLTTTTTTNTSGERYNNEPTNYTRSWHKGVNCRKEQYGFH